MLSFPFLCGHEKRKIIGETTLKDPNPPNSEMQLLISDANVPPESVQRCREAPKIWGGGV